MDSTLRSLHEWLLGPVGRVERFLDQAAWGLADAVLLAPVAVVALGVGVLAWRGRRPVAGIVAALAVQAAAFTDAWPALVQTVSLAFVVALVSAPLALAVSLGVARLLPHVPQPVRGSRVLAPLAAILVPAAVVGLSIPTGRAWLLALSAVTGVVGGVLLGSRPAGAWSDVARSHLFTAFALVVLAGLLGGPGIGGEVVRTVPTPEMAVVVSHLVVALGAACVVFLALASPREGVGP